MHPDREQAKETQSPMTPLYSLKKPEWSSPLFPWNWVPKCLRREIGRGIKQGIKGAKELALKIEGGMWWPKDKRADETKEGLGMQEQKDQTLIILPPPTMLELLMDQYSLSPLLPYREKVFALLFPDPV